MFDRSRGYERAVPEPQRTVRLITILILVVGAAAVVFAVTRPEARRERAVSGVAIGDTSRIVTERLGAARIVCAAPELAHLHGRFPGGWPTAARQQAVEWLEEHTAERWIYPLEDEPALDCSYAGVSTEIGIGEDGRILWIIPLGGRHALQLPPNLAPGTFTEDPDV